ncbi:MAG: S41 family peptidase [Turneriella sp.]|nr:S41 family peptidase [Turneriella sp.]
MRLTFSRWAFCILLLRALHAEPQSPGVLAQAEAQGDLRFIHSLFHEVHASAFTQIPPQPPTDLFSGVAGVNLRDFIARVLRYYGHIRVDHTSLGFPPSLAAALKLHLVFFPLPLKFFQGRAYLDCTVEGIPFGAELLELNGHTLPQILERFAQTVPIRETDGTIDDLRLEDSFSYLYYITFGPAQRWRLLVRSGGKQHKVEIAMREDNPLAFARRSLQKPQYQEPIAAFFNTQQRVAILALNTFFPPDKERSTAEAWNSMLYQFHEEARRTNMENLILDLRINRGGVMFLAAVAATWFIEQPVEDKTNSRARARVLPYREWLSRINGMAANEQLIRETEQHLQKEFSDTRVNGYFAPRRGWARYLTLYPVVQRHPFRKVFILVSRATYSAAVFFARLVKLGNPNALLVGEETGSPGDGHSAEILLSYRLPRSGLLLEIPMVAVQFDPVLPGQKPGRGLLPDIVSVQKAEDFVQERDTQLESIHALLSERR